MIKMLSYTIKSEMILALTIILFSNNWTLVKAECQGNFSAYFVYKPILKGRARPDWAYEFPDRTGPDTQICLTGPAGPD